jgi:hypothetical protein
MSDDYKIYGSELKQAEGPAASSYSSNVGEINLNKNNIERRKKEAAEDINPVHVGETAHQITESMGKVEPPLGEAISGTAKNLGDNLSPYLLAPPVLYGLYKAWQNYSGGNPPNTPPPPPPGPVAPTASAEPKPLSPLEQEALREKQLKNQRLEQAIQLDKERAERARLDHEIKQTQASLKQQQASGGSITETEAKMMAASNLAGQTKEATAEQKKITGKSGTAVSPVKEQHTFKSVADIPEGMVFRPDVGNLDRSLANILGPEHRLYAKELINEGKMFGHSKDINKDVSRLTTEYFQNLQGQIPETILSRDARKAQGIESKFGTYGSVLGKAAKVGGVAGTLMTLAQSANAKEAANALGEALLPIGATPSAVEPGTLTAKQLKAFEEAKKLGSPYRSVPPPR